MSEPAIHGYGHPEALGHRAIEDLLPGPVVVSEKVDGSQFSAAKIDGRLVFRSRKQEVHPGAAGMFAAGVDAFTERADAMHDGWIYRGEYLSKPKHNILAYERCPIGHTILFDVETDTGQHYLSADQLAEEAGRLALETVPVFHVGEVVDPESLRAHLENTSILGGQLVEGVVVKNYDRFGRDGRPLMGKLVRADFKEAHKVEWRAANPGPADVIESLITAYRTEARWRKVVQHATEEGRLQHAPQDIGPLLAEIGDDVEAEESDAIRDALYRWAWPKIRRGLSAGFPSWYKDLLAFGDGEVAA